MLAPAGPFQADEEKIVVVKPAWQALRRACAAAPLPWCGARSIRHEPHAQLESFSATGRHS